MKLELIALLETFGYTVRQQGSLAGKSYPDSFFTFWNGSSEDRAHYDNEPIDFVWQFTVYFYSTDPALVNTKLLDAIALLKQHGWIISGKGYDVPTDVITHTGRAFDALFIERVSQY